MKKKKIGSLRSDRHSRKTQMQRCNAKMYFCAPIYPSSLGSICDLFVPGGRASIQNMRHFVDRQIGNGNGGIQCKYCQGSCTPLHIEFESE